MGTSIGCTRTSVSGFTKQGLTKYTPSVQPAPWRQGGEWNGEWLTVIHVTEDRARRSLAGGGGDDYIHHLAWFESSEEETKTARNGRKEKESKEKEKKGSLLMSHLRRVGIMRRVKAGAGHCQTSRSLSLLLFALVSEDSHHL